MQRLSGAATRVYFFNVKPSSDFRRTGGRDYSATKLHTHVKVGHCTLDEDAFVSYTSSNQDAVQLVTTDPRRSRLAPKLLCSIISELVERLNDPLHIFLRAVSLLLLSTYRAQYRHSTRLLCHALGDCVATIHAQVGASHVSGRVAAQEGDRTHEILRSAHFALRDQASPLVREFRVLVQDLPRPTRKSAIHLFRKGERTYRAVSM